MESRVRQNMINTVKRLPHNDEAINLLKEMLIEYIEKDEAWGPIKPKTNIEKNFQEDMVNDMGSEFEDENYNNMY